MSKGDFTISLKHLTKHLPTVERLTAFQLKLVLSCITPAVSSQTSSLFLQLLDPHQPPALPLSA